MNNLYPQLLLLSVLIVFCLIGSIKFSNIEPYTQEELPIPQCLSGSCDDDDYILKSQIVPPVCPACPGFFNSKEDSKNIMKEETEKVDIEEETKEENKKESTNYSFKEETTTKENNPNKNNFDLGLNDLGLLSSKTKLLNNDNQTNISDEKNEIEQLKKKLEEMKKYEGNCQPCPACERCPEPSFDCKKVPNYRSTSVGQYLPIPVLNDFSSFS
jgi:hypothetical protein